MAVEPERGEFAHVEVFKAPASSKRREIVRAGLAVGPVLMTVLNRPVLAAQRDCGSLSVMQSMQTGTSLQCTTSSTGIGPNSWVSLASSWPSPYIAG